MLWKTEVDVCIKASNDKKKIIKRNTELQVENNQFQYNQND